METGSSGMYSARELPKAAKFGVFFFSFFGGVSLLGDMTALRLGGKNMKVKPKGFQRDKWTCECECKM